MTIRTYASIALVDLSYLFRLHFHGAGIGAPPNAGADRTLAAIAGIAADVDHVVLCLDRPPYRRRDLYEPYKANREDPDPVELGQKKALIAELKRRGYVTAGAKGYEADDIIATLAKAYGEWCSDVRIVAADKDATQCITDNVTQFIPAVGNRPPERRDRMKCLAKFKVYPDQMTLYQALVGDDSDNVPGVKGVGAVGAARVISELVEARQPVTLVGLSEALGGRSGASKANATWTAIATHWEDLRISYELVTLDTAAPIDPEALLAKLEASPAEPAADDGIELEQFVGNHTPPAEIERNETPMPPSHVAPANDRAVTDAEWEEGAHHVPPPADAKAADMPAAPKPGPVKATPRPAPAPVVDQPHEAALAYAIAKAQDEAKLGVVTSKLQPTDLRSAWTVSKWICQSGLYRAFDTPEKVFAVIQRGRELGLDAGAALLGFHIIEGKPSASADLIRALAERSADCEYFMWVSADDNHATWETKHRKHPRPTTFTYTIEQARKVPEYWKKDRWNNPSNWEKRPQEMLTKTAASKLARLIYPVAVFGLYAPEEFGMVLDTEGEAA